jgi:transcriptional regulator with XRE-family HTH domain
MELDLYKLGRRVAGTRTFHGWTQQGLADRAKVTQATVARLEKGQLPRVALDTIVAIADALGVGVDYLIGKTPDRDHLPDALMTPKPRRQRRKALVG